MFRDRGWHLAEAPEENTNTRCLIVPPTSPPLPPENNYITLLRYTNQRLYTFMPVTFTLTHLTTRSRKTSLILALIDGRGTANHITPLIFETAPPGMPYGTGQRPCRISGDRPPRLNNKSGEEKKRRKPLKHIINSRGNSSSMIIKLILSMRLWQQTCFYKSTDIKVNRGH